MNDYDLMVKLERIINDLVKVDGVDGSLIVDGMGNIIAQRILQDIDVELFGPMANVITSSSKRLLNSSHQGEINRVLVESSNGKALFLNLENVHLIVLMKDQANVGLILVSSKRAAGKITTLTKDLKQETVEPQVETEKQPIITESNEIAASIDIVEQKNNELTIKESVDQKSSEKSVPEELTVLEESDNDKNILDSEEEYHEKISETENKTVEMVETELEAKVQDDSENIFEEEYSEITEHEESIPIIKPPIAFPDIEKIKDVPEDMEARSFLILDIYEAIFRAMSIGASKIMGVAPARGLTQKFLPSQDCKKLLDGVGVNNNSTIDFNKIRENASKIAIEHRETEFIDDFTKILDVITDNYGKVMGYEAFRGMIRPEFKKIAESYGPVMNKLGINQKMHPEISDLFEYK